MSTYNYRDAILDSTWIEEAATGFFGFGSGSDVL